MQAKKKSKPVAANSISKPQPQPARRVWKNTSYLLLIVPLLVLWPVVFGGYTLSQNPSAMDARQPYGGFYDPVTIMDPGGNLLDEPSLVLVARDLAKGRIPMLNMKNGMGAPQVESLLTGTMYILNPLLLLLPTSKPLYYDLFIILHVYIFLFGAYFLLRRYASPTAAAVVSMLLTFSGVTFLHWNAIHYRSAVWMPWMMSGLVGVIRGEHVRRSWILLVSATVACGTAGNVQEFALDVFATCVIGGCEWVALQGPSKVRALVLSTAALAVGFAIASISFLPFFVARAQGWVYIPADLRRSTQTSDPTFLISWLIPRIYGPYTDPFLLNTYYHPHPDYSLMGFLLLLLGAVTGCWAWRSRSTHTAWLCLGPLAVVALGLLKIVHFPIFNFVGSLPLVKDLWFVKYHSYLFVLAAIPSAIGLDRVLTAELPQRRRLVGVAAVFTCGVLAVAIFYLRAKSNYDVDWGAPQPIIHETFRKWALTGTIFLGATAVLYFKPRHTKAILLALAMLQSSTLFPRGNGRRKPAYQPPTNYFAMALPSQRLLMADFANSNILANRESFAVTDSVSNRHYRDFMLAFFTAANAGTMFQPFLKEPLNDIQAMALRVAGVEAVFDYPLATKLMTGSQLHDPVPRAFLVTPETFNVLRNVKIRPANVTDVAARLEADLKSLPQPRNLRVINETVEVDLPSRSGPAILVINQAYSPNWTLGGRKPTSVADLWPAWEIPAGASAKASAVYWPEGLTTAMTVSAFGLIAAAAFYRFALPRENPA